MKSIQMTAAGGPEVLQLRETAEPQITHSEQIKVRLHAAGVNPVDSKIRKDGLFYDAKPPAILGCDGAGEIVEIGKQVINFAVGDQVWFNHGGLGREPGNYAEFAVLNAEQAQHKPKTLAYPEAAAAPLVLITAWEALFDRGHLQEGQTVLIHAGAGGVGHVAIQLAKIKGARVIATVGSAENAEFVRLIGADEVINYKTENLLSKVMALTDDRGVDLAMDNVGPTAFSASIPLIAHYGTLVTLLDPGKDLDLSEARMRNLQIAFTLMLTPMLRDLKTPRQHHAEILRQCAQWVDQGHLRIHVSQQFPLDQAAAAHAAIESGHTRGKIALLID